MSLLFKEMRELIRVLKTDKQTYKVAGGKQTGR
jgi:hypothetical protein